MILKEMNLLRITLVAGISVMSNGLIYGPSGPLVAPLGYSLVLLCYADKPLPIEGLKVEWRRTDSETLVLLYEDGEIQAEAQQQDYHCRANFLTNHIKHGNFSLRLDNLMVKDEGEYECKVYSQLDSGETVVQIKDVERLLVSGSDVIWANYGEDIIFNCSVDSHIPPEHFEEVSWRKTYADEEMVLLYKNNKTLLNASNERYRDRVEFFTDEIPKGNFSLRLKNVTYEDTGYYECWVFAGGASASTYAILGWVYGPCSDTSETKMKLVKHLGLNKSEDLITKMGPWMFSEVVYVYLDLYVSSIIEVNEKAQSLTTQVKIITAWSNWKMVWDYRMFCGIDSFVAPKNLFWIPDISIIESLKTEFGSKESPYVKLFNFGITASSDILSLTTACKMDLYKFPFDTQTCNLTLQSTGCSTKEIQLHTITNTSKINIDSKEMFKAQGEWDLFSINTTKDQTTLWSDIYVDQLIYQITIKRRPLLYGINIILPLFFFLVLDVMSFFIEASAADKLNFKVTLLLSISVFLLMVKDTLPSTADKIPLIGIYCSGIFILIGISILETILVKFLKAKGAKISVTTRATVSDQVGDQMTQQNKPEKTCLCWTRVARIIDMTFWILYIIAIIAFLSKLAVDWFP